MDPTMRPPGGSGGPMPPPLPPSATTFRTPPVFSLGDILAMTFTIYKANFLAFVIIIAVVSIPAIIAAALVGNTPPKSFLPGLLGFFTGPIGTAAITYGVFEHLNGRSTTVGDCLRIGLSKLVNVLGVALLTGLILLVAFVACVIPVFFAVAVFAVAVPVAVQEEVSASDALRRSAKLTEGYRWTVLAVLFLIGLIGGALGVPLGIILAFSGHADAAPLAGQIVSVFIGGLGATAPAVIYYRLRSIKESIDVRDIASVFD